MLIDFNIERFRNQKANELSLYEKYIISILRLSLRPLDIVLIDNIFENLTQEESNEILMLIKKLFIDKKVTTLVATSSATLLKGVCKRAIHFNNGSIV